MRVAGLSAGRRKAVEQRDDRVATERLLKDGHAAGLERGAGARGERAARHEGEARGEARVGLAQPVEQVCPQTGGHLQVAEHR